MKGYGHLRFEAPFLIHQSGKRCSVTPSHGEESLLRQSSSNFDNVIAAGIEVESLGRIAQPHISANQTRLPVHFALDHTCDLFVTGSAENPLLEFEAVVAAGQGQGHQFAGFHEFRLLAVDLFAQSIDDWSFRVFRLKRRQHFPQRNRKIHGHERPQAAGVFQRDRRVQNVKVRARRGVSERPFERETEREAGARHVDRLRYRSRGRCAHSRSLRV